MKIFNYEKKEKKLFGFELESHYRLLIKNLVKSKWPDKLIYECCGLSKKFGSEEMPESFVKYIKYIKRNYVLGDVAFYSFICADITLCTYIAMRIGQNQGIEYALTSDVYKKVTKLSNIDGKNKVLDRILSVARENETGHVLALKENGDIWGYLVTKFTEESPVDFDPKEAFDIFDL